MYVLQYEIKKEIMPAPNKNNPYHCDHPMRKSGTQKTKEKAQIYRCSCGFTCTDSDRPVGGQIIGTRKMTAYERELRWKERDPIGYELAQKRKKTAQKIVFKNY